MYQFNGYSLLTIARPKVNEATGQAQAVSGEKGK